MHKLKDYNKLTSKHNIDALINIESGLNRNKSAIAPNDKLIIDVENKIIKNDKKDQYQHNGKGTILFKKKDLKT